MDRRHFLACWLPAICAAQAVAGGKPCVPLSVINHTGTPMRAEFVRIGGEPTLILRSR